jgi:hypothetical protein
VNEWRLIKWGLIVLAVAVTIMLQPGGTDGTFKDRQMPNLRVAAGGYETPQTKAQSETS